MVIFQLGANLFNRNRCTRFFQLGFEFLSIFLANAFLDFARSTFDGFLGFFEAEAHFLRL